MKRLRIGRLVLGIGWERRGYLTPAIDVVSPDIVAEVRKYLRQQAKISL